MEGLHRPPAQPAGQPLPAPSVDPPLQPLPLRRHLRAAVPLPQHHDGRLLACRPPRARGPPDRGPNRRPPRPAPQGQRRHLPPQSPHYAAISDETSPPTVALFISGQMLWNIAYAKPGDEHWALIDESGWNLLPNQRVIRDGQQLRSIRYLSVVTRRGRIYFATFQGNLLRLRLHPKPRLVPIVKDQSDMVWDNVAGVLYENVISYLVEPEDTHNGRMLMVRYHQTLGHLSAQEQRRIKRRKKNNILIKQLINDRPRRYKWQVLEVFEVDLLSKRLVPVEDIGHRSLFVGMWHAFPSLPTSCPPSATSRTIVLSQSLCISSKIGAQNPLILGGPTPA
uniref:KIB1-4 beta-propeller domain-containing protein n=1 Tax=Leersia perrieri TaxID=77586 RepID=A0A0D9XI86_9ORYZ